MNTAACCAIEYAEQVKTDMAVGISLVLAAIASVALVVVSYRTLKSIYDGELFAADPVVAACLEEEGEEEKGEERV